MVLFLLDAIGTNVKRKSKVVYKIPRRGRCTLSKYVNGHPACMRAGWEVLANLKIKSSSKMATKSQINSVYVDTQTTLFMLDWCCGEGGVPGLARVGMVLDRGGAIWEGLSSNCF